METKIIKKKHLIVLDFDNTLYYNPSHDFSLDIPIPYILDSSTFLNELKYQTGINMDKNTELILISGRHTDQQKVILYLLGEKGYPITQSYFRTMDKRLKMDENSFYIQYWTGKVDLINKLSLSGKYEPITIIDDDPIICFMLKKLGFQIFRACIDFDLNIYFSEISEIDSSTNSYSVIHPNLLSEGI